MNKASFLALIPLLTAGAAHADIPAAGRYVIQQPDSYRVSVTTVGPQGRVGLTAIISAEQFPEGLSSQLPGAPELPDDPMPEVSLLVPGAAEGRPWAVEFPGSPIDPVGPQADSDAQGFQAQHMSPYTAAGFSCIIRGSLTQRVRVQGGVPTFVRMAEVSILDRFPREPQRCSSEIQTMLPAILPLNTAGDRVVRVADLRALLNLVQEGLGSNLPSIRQIRIMAESGLTSLEDSSSDPEAGTVDELVPLEPAPQRMPIY